MLEKELEQILDECNVSEADLLLKKEIALEIDEKALRRIKHSVYHKSGLKKQKKNFSWKGMAIAAAFALVLITVFGMGVDNFAAAIAKPFRLLPGYGIVEEEQEERGSQILYTLSAPAVSENETAVLTLNNVVAAKDSITIIAKFEMKLTDEGVLDKEEYLKHYPDPKAPKLNLYREGQKYDDAAINSAGSEIAQWITAEYALPSAHIDTATVYTLKEESSGLTVQFTLNFVESYTSLSAIGSTACKNDISITAVPEFKGNQLEVNLYPINKSGSHLDGFFRPAQGYLGQDLHLETSAGVRPYVMPDGYGDGHGHFVFNLEREDQDLVLKIPFLLVQDIGEEKVTLPIPKKGQRLDEEYRVEFKDSTIVISGLELVDDEEEYEQLKMDLRYEDRLENKKMISANLYRTNLWGDIAGGGYSSEIDESGRIKTIWFALEKGETRTLKLKFVNPAYYLIDEYALPLGRP